MEKRQRKSTMVEMVTELEKLRPLCEAAAPEAVQALDMCISEAKAGEFHDYKNKKHACGKVAAYGYLRQFSTNAKTYGFPELSGKLNAIADDVKNGVYDEEADEEDKAYMRKVMDETGMSSQTIKDLFGL